MLVCHPPGAGGGEGACLFSVLLWGATNLFIIYSIICYLSFHLLSIIYSLFIGGGG